MQHGCLVTSGDDTASRRKDCFQWKPWDGEDHLCVVQKVKETIGGNPESKAHRKILTKAIAKETSCQEFKLGR